MTATVATITPLPRPAPGGVTLNAEADHRIGNNLALIAAMLRLQSSDLAKASGSMPVAEVRLLLVETAGRVEAVGRLHRLLADCAGQATIDVRRYIKEIAQSVVSSVGRSGSSVTLLDTCDACPLPPSQVLPIGLIVGEVISNAIKYAHPTGIPTTLSMDCRQEDRGILIEIEDDGVGLPESFNPAKDGGLGFRLVRSLAQQIDASVTFESTPLGLRFRMAVPS